MQRFDAIVIGASTVGAAAALGLARLGHQVALVDRKPPRLLADDEPLDARVIALSPGSRRLLEALDAWPHVREQRIAAYHDMQVMAGRGAVEFSDAEHGLSALGWIIELAELDRALWQELEDHRRITRFVPAEVQSIEPAADEVRIALEDKRQLAATMLIGADGANSRVRRAAGIASHDFHYNQRALVTHLETEKLNPGIAWQRFTALGPLALLPLPEGRSSLVWSVHDDTAERLMAGDDASFIDALNRHAEGSPFGPVEKIDRRYALPLVRRQSERLSAGRIVLVGDAARSVHPLAGQGLNLGLGDIAALIEALDGWQPRRDPDSGLDSRPDSRPDSKPDPGRRLTRAASRRWSDSRLVGGGIHLINEARGFGQLGLHAMGVGFAAMRLSRTARDLFVQRACGLREVEPAVRILNASRY